MQEFKPTWLYVKQHTNTGLKYFGKTCKDDPVAYAGSGKYWIKHLRKHGKHIDTLWHQLFTDKDLIVEFAMKFSKENNIYESKEWANLKFENGLDGGSPGVPRTNETRQKLSIANIGKLHLQETKSKISESNKGKHTYPKSEETREKISKALSGRVRGPMSEKTKSKISEANKGKISSRKGTKLSEETKSKIGNSNRGNKSYFKNIPRTDEDRLKISNSVKDSLRLICPHCSKEGLAGCMKRWHFNNCRQK